MRIVDANVLIYTADEGSRHHRVAQRWLDGALTEGETLGFAWVVVVAFLRVSTLPGAFARPLTAAQALDMTDVWLARPSAQLVEPASGHLTIVRALLAAAGTAGNLVNDAHLAALAVEYGAEVVSFDRDFARFPGVRWSTPS